MYRDEDTGKIIDVDMDTDVQAQDLAKMDSDALMSYLDEQMTSSEFPWDKLEKAVCEIDDDTNASKFGRGLLEVKKVWEEDWESLSAKSESIKQSCGVSDISGVALLYQILPGRLELKNFDHGKIPKTQLANLEARCPQCLDISSDVFFDKEIICKESEILELEDGEVKAQLNEIMSGTYSWDAIDNKLKRVFDTWDYEICRVWDSLVALRQPGAQRVRIIPSIWSIESI